STPSSQGPTHPKRPASARTGALDMAGSGGFNTTPPRPASPRIVALRPSRPPQARSASCPPALRTRLSASDVSPGIAYRRPGCGHDRRPVLPISACLESSPERRLPLAGAACADVAPRYGRRILDATQARHVDVSVVTKEAAEYPMHERDRDPREESSDD